MRGATSAEITATLKDAVRCSSAAEKDVRPPGSGAGGAAAARARASATRECASAFFALASWYDAQYRAMEGRRHSLEYTQAAALRAHNRAQLEKCEQLIRESAAAAAAAAGVSKPKNRLSLKDSGAGGGGHKSNQQLERFRRERANVCMEDEARLAKSDEDRRRNAAAAYAYEVEQCQQRYLQW